MKNVELLKGLAKFLDPQKLQATADTLVPLAKQGKAADIIARRVIHSRTRSNCCGALQQLVQSRAGNFVTQNCVKCGSRAKTLSLSEIPKIGCPECANLLAIGFLGKNYGSNCTCGCRFELGSILPNWREEGFQYCGVAAPGDQL